MVLDKETQKNCLYGYAQFLTDEEAKKAQADLNNKTINDKVITVSFQLPNANFNSKANVLVRNLAASATQKDIHSLFAKFGPISKCKLECYADGLSRGFCYVQFEHEKDATAAIESLNGTDF